MPLGDLLVENGLDNKSTWKKILHRIYAQVYGINDLHSHIRWRAIKEYIDFQRKAILDAGCGAGLMTFEVAKQTSKNMTQIIGIDPNKESIEIANRISSRQGLENVEFKVGNIMDIEFDDETFDEALCIDVLEHVPDDNKAVCEVSRVLKEGGRLIISVPTPNYPKFFGREFAQRIGHLRDGYWHYEIAKLLQQNGIRVIKYKYYTLFPSSLVCSFFYRVLKGGRLATMISPILNIFSFLDFLDPVPMKTASSLAVLAEKKGLRA